MNRSPELRLYRTVTQISTGSNKMQVGKRQLNQCFSVGFQVDMLISCLQDKLLQLTHTQHNIITGKTETTGCQLQVIRTPQALCDRNCRSLILIAAIFNTISNLWLLQRCCCPWIKIKYYVYLQALTNTNICLASSHCRWKNTNKHSFEIAVWVYSIFISVFMCTYMDVV